jgi:tetratricopeptide (TPR) repeat protein
MPIAPPTEKTVKPNALELFTDRVGERQLLSKLLGPVPTLNLGLTFLLTQFYGVGGIGKSMLCRHACEIATNDFKDEVRVVATSFDDNRWNEGAAFTDVSAELCRGLVEQKIIPRLTVALLSLHGQQTGRNGEVVGGVDAGWELAFTAMENGADLTGIPGMGMVVKSARWVRDRAHRKGLRQELNDRGLWPEEQYGKLNIADLDKKLASALYWDLLGWLKENPEKHVRLLLDGFERLQSSERREDSQRRLQEFIGYFAGPNERDCCDRFRTVIFGRNQLRWDQIYEDPTWLNYWNLHLLGGLAESDAREFLRKTRTWLTSHGQSALADALVKYEDKVLDATEETKGGQRFFYPFYLNLAVELVERVRQSGKELELGRAPSELQDRFFRYLEQGELRALMILALSEVFDERLFDWLAKERLIDYPQHSFHSQLRREHSYLEAIEGSEGDWRFHRLMENALQARWQSTPEIKREGGNLFKRLLDYYGTPLLAKPERDWTEADVESWRRGMEIIVKQGPELELLTYEEWKPLLEAKPWSAEYYRCDVCRVDFTRRLLRAEERMLGLEHPDTLASVADLGHLVEQYGDYTSAEALYQRALEGRNKVLGSEHPDTLESIQDLGDALMCIGDYEAAEPLYRRVLDIREKSLGPDHSDVAASLTRLANVLRETDRLAEAEPLLRRALDILEKSLGPDHPDVATALNNLASLLDDTNRSDEAEPLYRRALVIWETNLGPEHPLVGTALNNLAILLRETNRLAEAEPLYHRALAIKEKSLGPDHPDVATSLNNLAFLLDETNRLAEAEPLYRRALDIWEKSLGPDHPDVATSLNNLAVLLKATNRLAEAEPLYRRALDIREKSLGPDHPDVANSLNSLAIFLKATNRLTEAEPLYRRALAIREKSLGPDHPDVARSLNSLANLLKATNRLAEAEPLFRRALAIREKNSGGKT